MESLRKANRAETQRIADEKLYLEYQLQVRDEELAQEKVSCALCLIAEKQQGFGTRSCIEARLQEM
eukprot:174946-Amphidinium_carterae.3